MARTGFFHHIGTFLLLAATVLLIITCISAPVVPGISILKVDLGRNSRSQLFDDRDGFPTVTFGSFGYCANGALPGGRSDCPRAYGYSPLAVMRSIDGATEYSDYAEDTTRALTKVMILHPIAAGINFIAFVLALSAGTIGSLLASLVALLAFLVTAVACIIDFVLFSIVRSNINDNGTSSAVYYGSAAWTILVSAICSLIGAIVVFFTCCSGRLHRRRERRSVGIKNDYGAPVAPRRRRRFW